MVCIDIVFQALKVNISADQTPNNVKSNDLIGN